MVTAVNGGGESGNSNQVSATPQVTAPGAPTNLAATGGNAQVGLTWSGSTGATSYNVKRGTVSGGPYTTVGSPTGTSFTDTGLTNGTTYYYVVTAVNGGGESGNSNQVSATPQATAPGAPTNLAATGGNAQVGLTWSGSTGATSYNVKRGTVSGGPYTTVGSPTGTSFTDTGLTNGTTYYYVVTAVNGGGESGNSNQASATPQATAPGAPTNLAATGGNAQVGLTWSGSTGATSYNVKRGTVSGGPYTTVGSPTGTSFTDTGLTNGTTYYYVVTAVNGGGESGNSNQASATPAASVTAINYGSGFSAAGMQLNGSTTLSGTRLRLTDGRSVIAEASSAYATTPVNVQSFTTNFSVQMTSAAADGMTFVIQNNGLTALGPAGGGLGYGPEAPGTTNAGMSQSVAVKFDFYSNVGEGADSTGLYTGGASPTTPAVDMTSSGVNLKSGDVLNVQLSYDGTTLRLTITDATTLASFTTSWAVNIPGAVGGNTAFVGFTAGSGAYTSIQDVLNWTYSTGAGGGTPGAPTNLTATAGDTQAGLTWSGSTGATSYNVKRGTVSGGPYTTVGSPTGTSFTDTGLTNGTAYYYVVTAVNGGGESGNSNQASATPQVTAPGAPTNLAATGGNAQVGLTWSGSTGATSYNVKRGTVSGGPYTTVGSPTGTSFTDTGLTNGTTYYYVVTAVNGGGESGNSNQASATPQATAPGAPTNLAATGGNAQVGLTWSGSTGATSYNVKRGTVSGGPYTTVGSPTGTSFTDTGLTNGTTYYYVVTAVNGGGESGNSNQASATPQATAPGAPTNLAATGGNAQVGLTWSGSTGATSYNVKRGTVSGGPYTTVGSPTGTSFTDTGLTNGTTYYYVVTAVNGGGESGNSNQASATPQATAPGAPTNLAATGGNAQVGLTWSGSTGATSYNVKRGTVSGGPYTTVGSPTGTSFTDSGLTNGTTYYYVVTAVNGGGESGNSNQASATPKAPDFSIAATPSSTTVAPGLATSYSATITALNGFTGAVAFNVSGLPTGTAASFTPSSVSGSGSSTMAVTTSSSTPVGTYPLTITGTSGALVHTTQVTLVVADFTISVSPSTRTVNRGSQATYTVTITPAGSFGATVSFSVTGVPSRVNASFSPASVAGSGTSTLSISTNRKAGTGTFPLTITGSGGGTKHSQNVSLVIQ